MAGRCTATTKAGAPCGREATHGAHCYQHAPATAAKAAASSKRGGKRRQAKGKRRAKGKPVLDLVSPPAAPTPEEVRTELGSRAIATHQDLVRWSIDLAQAALRGDIDSRDASRAGFLVQPVIRSGALPKAEPAKQGGELDEEEVLEMTTDEAIERVNAINSGRR